MAQLVALFPLVEVNVESATSAVIVPLVGIIVPWVALQATGMVGREPSPSVSVIAELSLMSAVTVDVPPRVREPGEAPTPSTIHGLKSTPEPLTTPQPVLFGPALQPHQLFSITPFSVPVKPEPDACITWELELLMMRFSFAATLRVKPVSASRWNPSTLFSTVLLSKVTRISLEPNPNSLVVK